MQARANCTKIVTALANSVSAVSAVSRGSAGGFWTKIEKNILPPANKCGPARTAHVKNRPKVIRIKKYERLEQKTGTKLDFWEFLKGKVP